MTSKFYQGDRPRNREAPRHPVQVSMTGDCDSVASRRNSPEFEVPPDSSTCLNSAAALRFPPKRRRRHPRPGKWETRAPVPRLLHPTPADFHAPCVLRLFLVSHFLACQLVSPTAHTRKTLMYAKAVIAWVGASRHHSFARPACAPQSPQTRVPAPRAPRPARCAS